MGKLSRRKGREAQCELKHLLGERDWQIIETSCGQAVEDMVVTSPQGTVYSCECKHAKIINLGEFFKQARDQAKRRALPWMLCCQLPAYPSSWLVFRSNMEPEIWRRRGDNHD